VESLVDPVTRGDPQSPLRWTGKRPYQLASALQAMGHGVGARTGAPLVQPRHYSLPANRKTRAGAEPPDREAQCTHRNDHTRALQGRQQPVVLVATKKQAVVGDCTDAGPEGQPKGAPEAVRGYAVMAKQLGTAIP
jgi:hypothetical protein